MNFAADSDQHFQMLDRVVWWRGRTAGRWQAVFCKIVSIESPRVRVEFPHLSNIQYRWVPIDRLQPVRVWREKVFIDKPRALEPTRSWGTSTHFAEIGEDLFVTRSIDVFENGFILRYDRSYWKDGFGSIGFSAYCRVRWRQWWGPTESVSQSEFEKVWTAETDTNDFQQELQTRGPMPQPPHNPWTRSIIEIGA